MKLNYNCLGRIFQLRYFKVPSLPIKGYTSRTEDGKHVLFLDYDLVSPEIVKLDIETLMKEHNISHAYIFTTHEEEDKLGLCGNYHVICLEKFYFTEILDMMGKTHCDSLHRNLAKRTRYRSWVLRFTGKGNRGKPRFIKLIINYDHLIPTREISSAHNNLIQLLSNADLLPYTKNFDKKTIATLTYYNTLKEFKR